MVRDNIAFSLATNLKIVSIGQDCIPHEISQPDSGGRGEEIERRNEGSILQYGQDHREIWYNLPIILKLVTHADSSKSTRALPRVRSSYAVPEVYYSSRPTALTIHISGNGQVGMRGS